MQWLQTALIFVVEKREFSRTRFGMSFISPLSALLKKGVQNVLAWDTGMGWLAG